MLEIDNMAIEKPLGFILKILRIMDDGAVNVVKSFVGDPAGDYKYLGELEPGKHFVEYMFTDDCVDADIVLCVGGPQCLVVTCGQCRYAVSDESSLAMKHLAAIADEY